MADGKMFRWYTDEDIEKKVGEAKDAAIEAAVRAVLAMDAHLYDEDTIRAAAKVIQDMVRGKS